uniref:Uncharacterized protein n=1 Tax=Salmo trutta TaxID=8032 RepID=A0A673XR12_SALTR
WVAERGLGVGEMAHLPTAIVIDNGTDQMRLCFGDEAWGRRDDLSVIRPMKRGRVVSWADMEAIWSYVFNMHVKTPSCESPVLLTEFPLTTKSDREKTCRMMFEGLGVPALYLAPQSLLALLSSGRVTGSVVDCGRLCNLHPHHTMSINTSPDCLESA